MLFVVEVFQGGYILEGFQMLEEKDLKNASLLLFQDHLSLPEISSNTQNRNSPVAQWVKNLAAM